MKADKSKRNQHLRNGAKIIGCAMTIAAMAMVFTIFGSSGTVTESHADVSWLSHFEQSKSEKFTKALDNMGHSDAERYDLNGNTVFFSNRATNKSPRQVMAEYQEEFQRQGLNDRVYLDVSSDERQARNKTALTGGLIPLAITDHHIALGGVITSNDADDDSELIDNYHDAEKDSDLFRAHRYIEISRSPESRHTSIIATWSDEEFDYERMVPGSRAEGQGFDTTIMPCPNCTRLTRFADDNRRNTQHVDLSFIGPRSVDETRQFYARTLTGEGWEREDIDAPLRELEQWIDLSRAAGQTDVYRRGGEELKLTFIVDRISGETLTMASLTGS